MDALVGGECLAFGSFRLEPRSGRLLRQDVAGDWVQVPIGSRALGILGVLLNHPGAVVSKDAIMDAVWPGLAVEPNNLTVQIAALRRVLDEGRDSESCIQTVPGRGYRFVLGVSKAAPDAAPDPPPVPQAISLPCARPGWLTRRLRIALAGSVASVVLLLIAVWQVGWFSVGLTLPRLSIVVPPFDNPSGDPKDDHPAEGITDNLTADPAGVTHAFVIARNSAETYKGKDRRQSAIVLPFENSSGDPAQDDLAAALTRYLTDRIALGHNGPVVPAMTASAYRGKSVDLGAIGRKYDVHFALVGNVRRQAGFVILSANAYDIADAQPIWSRQFDLPDGPGALTTVVQKIYEGYWQTSVDVEAGHAMRDHPDRLDKRDLMNVARSTRLSVATKEHYLEKMSLVDRVLAIDPNDFQGLERQARFHAEFVLQGYSSNPAADLAIAEKASDRLFAIDPNDLLALRARTAVLRAQGDWPAAEAVVRRAIGLQPTEAMRHYELGFILMAEGRHQEALQSFRNARRFAGGSDPVHLFDANTAMANLAIGQLTEAIAMARTSISEFPPNTGRIAELPWLALIAATSDSGQDDEARADLHRFLATPRSWHSMSQIQEWPASVANRNLLDGLRNAGMPAE
ncbi:MAG TPA: winged helix-turn-helix domain-containing protein [Acetobacteraceae bacterium]|nr:winged helix-turn-helix domain-containing protein [Acetobacteraceae bacterium]